MKLSAPIYRLKRNAKLLSAREKIPLNAALDRIARQEGFPRWSLLVARQPASSPAAGLLARLAPGDLLLVAARPGQGKTLLSLELAVEAMKRGNRAAFFTLEYTAKDVLDRLRAIGANPTAFDGLFDCDCSDEISAGYVMDRLATAPRGTFAVIDYLQLLDQRRDKPALMDQVSALKAFARDRQLIITFLSQVDRSYDAAAKPCPDMRDIRLPNPLDVQLFDKTCFLGNGAIAFRAAGEGP